jgi:hypothetical protein
MDKWENPVPFVLTVDAAALVVVALLFGRGNHGAGSNKAFWPFWSALPRSGGRAQLASYAYGAGTQVSATPWTST